MKLSLPLQIVFAVALGAGAGLVFPAGELKPLAEVGKAVIHWVKLVAGPFLFLTVVASITVVRLTAGHGLRLLAIAFLNTAIAIALGMGLAHLLLDGVQLPSVAASLGEVKTPDMNLSFTSWLKTLTPPSLFSPFVQNEILMIALLGLLTGLAIRGAYGGGAGPSRLGSIARWFEAVREVPAKLLHWLILLMPLAVLTVVAGAVSEHGLGVFGSLARYVGVVLLGFALQITFVYGTWVFLVARLEPRAFFRAAKAPVLYAFGVNSSLATLPLTLKGLNELGVSGRSASLGAGVATNLNNDGIVLYEAMAVFFVAQVVQAPLSDAQMLTAALACIVASMGITGIPEAGFISLSVVLATLGLPIEMLPLLLAVDWMIARGRSVVNVLSDMTLSIAMDATERRS